MFERYIDNPNVNNSVKTVLYTIDEVCRFLKSFFAPKLFANFYFVKGNDDVDEGVLHDARNAKNVQEASSKLEFEEENSLTPTRPILTRQNAIQEEEESDSILSDDEMNDAWDDEGMFKASNNYAEDPYYTALKAGINPLAEMISHPHTSNCISGECEHISVHELVGHHNSLIEAATQ